MAKFNGPRTRPAVQSPVRTETVASGTTFEGAPGYARDAQSELFLLAVTNMVGEDTFYETGGERDSRFAALVRQIAVTDFDWLTRFAHWLRSEANMRSASLVLAAEAAKARLDAGETGGRDIIKTVLQRADEPGEMLSYWHAHYGRKLPKPVKRGIADAARRLYSERSYLKWDSDTRAIRFADVIQLTHPDPDGAQVIADLYHYIIGRRIGVDDLAIPGTLPTLRANAEFKRYTGEDIDRMAVEGRLPQVLADAGVTWEALSAFGAWSAPRWEAIIPSMGYMALLRNLRNFDQAGVSDVIAATVAARLSDPDEVARSRQFPFRFYAAHKATGSLRWGHALEVALRHSLSNVPDLPGRTLILVDQSPSMFTAPRYAGNASKSDIALAEKAALFGSALALRADHADLYGYGFRSYPVQFSRGDAVLKTMEKFHVDNGTDTFGALQRHYAGHDRVLIITDEQTWANREIAYPHVRQAYGLDALRPLETLVPAHVPVFTWNLGGYQYGHATGTNWHIFGGLTDKGFEMIGLLERGRDADWPF